MSLKPTPIGPVPELTAYVARAAFPDGNAYLAVRDALGTFYDDERFAGLFPDRGRPAEAPWRLALVTVLQFAEGLPDRQAADAVRGRIDWKYALGLELTDPGFDFSVLCEFRDRLIAGGAERLLLEAMLETCKGHGLVKPRTRRRTDSTHVLAAIRTLNRRELVGETLRAALNSLATVASQWLRAWVPPEWSDRHSSRVEESRLPKGEEARYAHGEAVGADGFRLLEAVYGLDSPRWLGDVPAVEVLRRVWLAQYYL
jgi:transposase